MVEALAAKGVRLRAEGGDLKYGGPKSVLTPETLARLKAHKSEIVAVLRACFAELKVQVVGYAIGHEKDLRHQPFG
jgi:hypothetical protein